jgi:FG-GAP-like repeat/IPT/TIG domain
MRLLSLLFTVVVSVVALGQVPTITSFSPTSGPVGTTVTITGTGFSTTLANNVIHFGAVKATVSAATTTSLTVTVPVGTGTNQIQYSNISNRYSCLSPIPFILAINSSNSFTSGTYNTNFTLGTGYGGGPGEGFDFTDNNNDGKIDIIYQGLTGSTQSLKILTNSSVSSSSVISSQLTETELNSWSGNQYGGGPMLTSDFNGDGFIDVHCTSIGYSGTMMLRQSNSSPGTYVNQAIAGVSSYQSGPRAIDFTNDGKIDIVSAYFHPSINFYQQTNTTDLSTASPTINMSYSVSNIGGNAYYGSCALDFDNNGYLDPAFFVSDLSSIQIKPNSNSGLGANISISAATTKDIFGADIDGDGKLEIISCSSGQIQVFRNTSSIGSISFAAATNFSIGNTNSVNALEIIDFNNDGKPDVVALQDNRIVLYINSSTGVGNISFNSPIQLSNSGDYGNDIAIVDINNDGAPEIFTRYSQMKVFTYVAPPVTASPNSLSGFSTCAGTVSAAQSTTISGSGLGTTPITVTPPSGYEVSLALGSGYSSSLTLSPSSGTVSPTIVYVRLNSTATAGNYNGNLTATSGSNSATVALSGVKNLNSAGTASSNPTLCINSVLTDITRTTSGATGIGTASGLPAGITAAWSANTITVSGTPTASGTYNYTIPLTGGCGSVNATGTITVSPASTVGAASYSPNVCPNVAMTSVTHATTGATGIGSATGLPTGLTAAWASNTITISGTPTQSGTFNYSIPLTGCGSVNATGTIIVKGTNLSVKTGVVKLLSQALLLLHILHQQTLLALNITDVLSFLVLVQTHHLRFQEQLQQPTAQFGLVQYQPILQMLETGIQHVVQVIKSLLLAQLIHLFSLI